MTNPDRVAFILFGKEIYWYAIFMAVGIIVAAILASIGAKRKKMHPDTVIDICLWTIPLGIICARLYYVIFNWAEYAGNPMSALYIWEGGLAIPGAILGGALGVFIYSRIRKQRFLRYADIIVPGLAIAQAIGRWGNFFNQEAFGPEVFPADPLQWWFIFPLVIRKDYAFGGQIIDHSYHLATFFYESCFCVIIFLVLWFLRKRIKHDGDALITYLLLYCFERTIMEALRTDALLLGTTGIRVTQVLTFVVFCAVLIFVIIRSIREKKLKKTIWPKPLAIVELSEASNVSEQNVESDKSEKEASIEADNADFVKFGVPLDALAETGEADEPDKNDESDEDK